MHLKYYVGHTYIKVFGVYPKFKINDEFYIVPGNSTPSQTLLSY